VVGTSNTAVQSFFGFSDWPDEVVTLDLGNRTLDVLGIPGHQNQSVAVFDSATGLLLTGDTLYPGHLFVSNWSVYRDSIQRLVAMAMARPVTFVMGTHVEMSTTPGVTYPYGSTYQPDEHALQLDLDVLFELDLALGPNPEEIVTDHFIVLP